MNTLRERSISKAFELVDAAEELNKVFGHFDFHEKNAQRDGDYPRVDAIRKFRQALADVEHARACEAVG